MSVVVAGVGFRRSALADEIVSLVEQALAHAGVRRVDLVALATPSRLADIAGFLDAAERLAVERAAVSEDDLLSAGPAVRTRSERSLAAHGVGSVAEAAALAAAGLGSTLILERIASTAVTCALASRPDRGGTT